MTSKERLLTAINGDVPDRVPLVARCFGFGPRPEWTWQRAGKPVPRWFTGRLEHIHTLPERWNLPDDDFKRVEAWLSLGLDDVLEVSAPWSVDPRVQIRDYQEPPSAQGEYPVSCREYTTPDGVLTHKIKLTGEATEPGWVIQPEQPPLFEDYNIPRATRHAVMTADDLPKLNHLLCRPSDEQLEAFRERMAMVRRFADDKQVLVAAWTLFGMDGVVWLCGAENAVMMAMTQPDLFEQVVRRVDEFDRMRTDLMLEVGGADLIVQRGWYSSVDFWSPTLFEKNVLPYLKKNVARVHQAGKKFAYAMTSGVKPLLRYLPEADVDLWYWCDPAMGDADNRTIRRELGGKVAVAGGVNAPLTLGKGTAAEIRRQVTESIEGLGPAGLILEPVDSLFPNTPPHAVEAMIGAWKDVVS